MEMKKVPTGVLNISVVCVDPDAAVVASHSIRVVCQDEEERWKSSVLWDDLSSSWTPSPQLFDSRVSIPEEPSDVEIKKSEEDAEVAMRLDVSSHMAVEESASGAVGGGSVKVTEADTVVVAEDALGWTLPWQLVGR